MDTIYVLINTELEMPVGKVVAQAVHAALNLAADSLNYNLNPFEEWYLNNPNAVIVLDGINEETMQKLEDYLLNSNLPARFFDYKDEGALFQKTALACGPFPKDHPMVKAVFGQFELYKDYRTELDLLELREQNNYLSNQNRNLAHLYLTVQELAKRGSEKKREAQAICNQILKEINTNL